MTHHPSSLTGQFDSLRASVQAESARGGLTALIMACLARIFGRLEQIFLLWQSGELPVPQPREVAPRMASNSYRPVARRARGQAARPRGSNAQVAPAMARAVAVMPAPRARDCLAPFRAIASSIRPRPARAPPPH